mgnify:CR=1 FL=1
MRRLILIILSLLTINASSSILDNKKTRQMKSAIQTARTAIKNSKDLEKNENTIRGYLNDSLFVNNKDLRLVLFELLKRQYEVSNEKMYKSETIDTAAHSKVGKRMFLAAESLDSIDALPNSKGVSTPSYRKRHSQYLTPYRANILKGAIYFMSHKQWQEAWEQLDVYLSAPRNPLFTGVEQDTTHTNFAAFLAVMTAYKLNDKSKAEHYFDLATNYIPRREFTLRKMAEMEESQGDTVRYVDMVTEGFRYYPESEYFFPRLIDYYIGNGDMQRALAFTDEAMQKDSLNQLFLYAKHNILMYIKKYDDALKYGKKVLMQNDSLAAPHYNIGYIYYLRAGQAMSNRSKSMRQRMKDAQKQYKKSLPYMERYRALEPEDISRWRPILYDIYLNLNMGEKFREINSLGD